MEIRLFKQEDAIEVAQLVAKTLKVSNSKDYSSEYINDNINSHSACVRLSLAGVDFLEFLW